MNLTDYKVGDILLITHKMKNGYDTRIGQVSCINYNENGLVTYYSHQSPDFLSSGSSAFDPEKIGKKPFGVISICVVDHIPPSKYNHQGPKPGDRGYDLMC